MGAAGAGTAAGAVQGGFGLVNAKMQANAMQAQGEWQAQQIEFNEKMLETQRLEIDKKAQNDINLRQRDVSAMLGIQKATMAANGIDLGSDVVKVVEADTRRTGREDVEAIKNNAWREAWGIGVKQADLKMQAGFARAGGNMNAATTLATGGLNAVSSLASGYANDMKNSR